MICQPSIHVPIVVCNLEGGIGDYLAQPPCGGYAENEQDEVLAGSVMVR